MKAEDRVRKTIKEHSLISKGDVLILGLSGGPDSLSLLHILYDMQREFSFTLKAYHLNHSIREDADDDMNFLIDYCRKLNIPLTVSKKDIPGLAQKNGSSAEEEGRNTRQKELNEIVLKEQGMLSHGKARAVLAHNADDQAETVFLRILRGTGTRGLAAMEYERTDGLIRPLLDTKRAEVEEYCRRKELPARIDSTNSSKDYLRNRVRLEILPLLSDINPNIKEGLRRLAKNASEDESYLSSIAYGWTEENFEEGSVSVKAFGALEPAIFQRAVKECFKRVGLIEDISSVHIENLRLAVSKNIGNKKIEFPSGYYAYINHGRVSFLKQ